MDSSKLYVGNLSFDATDDVLTDAFSPFGTVQEVRIITDKFSGRSRGFAFVTMSTDEEAQAAIEGLNGKEILGRPVTVNVARPPKSRDDRDRNNSGSRGPRRDNY